MVEAIERNTYKLLKFGFYVIITEFIKILIQNGMNIL